MGNFRFKYGTAYGQEGNFQSRTDNAFTSTDTTPDVTAGNLFVTDNASATSITHFDVVGANPLAEHQGKEIRIVILDNNTTLVNSTVLRLADGVDVKPLAGSVLDFIYLNSTWYETYRSYNTANQITVTSSNIAASGAITIGPHVSSVLALAGASSNFVLHGMLGGYTGQLVSVHSINSQCTIRTNSVGYADGFVVRSVGGTSALLTGTGSILFRRIIQGTTARWVEISALSASSG